MASGFGRQQGHLRIARPRRTDGNRFGFPWFAGVAVPVHCANFAGPGFSDSGCVCLEDLRSFRGDLAVALPPVAVEYRLAFRIGAARGIAGEVLDRGGLFRVDGVGCRRRGRQIGDGYGIAVNPVGGQLAVRGAHLAEPSVVHIQFAFVQYSLCGAVDGLRFRILRGSASPPLEFISYGIVVWIGAAVRGAGQVFGQTGGSGSELRGCRIGRCAIADANWA